MVSICIPTHEMSGISVVSLKQLLDSLCNQTYKRFEVIISDDSKDDSIKNFLDKANYPLDIRYIKNSPAIPSMAFNLNNAIREAKYPIIKPLLQHDYVINNKMIGKIIGTKGKWGALSWKHPEKNKTINPKWTNNILIGNNKLGSTSGIYFEKKDNLLFDEKLTQLTEVDLYYRLNLTYGIPYYINEPCLISEESSIRNNPDQLREEIGYLAQKHNQSDLEKRFKQRLKWMKYKNALANIKRMVLGA